MNFIKRIMKNGFLLSKIILIIVFAVLLMATVNNSFFKEMQSKSAKVTVLPFNEKIEQNYASKFSEIVDKYRFFNIDNFYKNLKRDIFFPKKQAVVLEHPFTLKEIVFDSVGFEYKGHIEKSLGVWIAQINWNHRTRFLKEGDALDDWTVLQIRTEAVLLLDKQGQEVELPLNKKIFAKEPYVKLFNNETFEERDLYIGNSFSGYKVLDIQKSAVILKSNFKKITISKR